MGPKHQQKLLAAAQACELAAEAPAGSEQELRAVYAVLQQREAMQIGLIQSEMGKLSGPLPGHERLPLRDEGYDFGEVEARVPKKLFWHLMQQKNFGWDGFTSDEGMRDLLKAYPACRTKTVSGKTTVAVTSHLGKGSRRAAGRVNFGRGTLQLAS